LLAGAILIVAALALASLFVGVSRVSVAALFDGSGRALQILAISRVPRTVALVIAGAAMAVSGTIIQMLARNRFVEPSTTGTVEAASLGMLLVMLLAPDMPVFGKMLVAAAFALGGTTLFMRILRAVPLR